MLILLATLLSSAAGDYGVVLDHLAGRVAAQGMLGKVVTGLADHFVTLKVSPGTRLPGQDSVESDEYGDKEDADESDDSDRLEVLPPPLAEGELPPVPPVRPVAPVPPGPGMHGQVWRVDQRAMGDDLRSEEERALPPFTEKAKNVLTVDLLHRIAQAAGWSMTLVGAPRERIDIDVRDQDPREVLRTVLKASGAMGVLKRDRLVVVASPDKGSAGMLVEQVDGRHRVRGSGPAPTPGANGKRHGGKDMVRVFQGDVTVKQGQIVQGDVVCVGGSIELEPGSVVQGDAVAVGGSVIVNEGALVLGQGVAVLGEVDVARGAQVMGEHVQVGLGRLFSGRPHHSGWLTSLGPFGLFPTLALFAVMYLIGLVTLRMWPDRIRNVSHAMFESPVRSFIVGFLCWLLLLPLVLLLGISLVGIPLIPLLPVVVFLSIVLGLSSLALRIGESLPAGPNERFVPPAALGMGMTVLLLLAFVPWLGISLLALLQFFALGASVGSRFGRALPPHVG